jgi:N-acetylneuraminic acid mutarotase
VRVVDDADVAVPSVSVTVTQAGSTQTATTADQGTAQFNRLKAGTASVAISTPSSFRASQTTRDVNLSASAPVTTTFALTLIAGNLEVTAKDTGGGYVPGATIAATRGSSATVSATTDALGLARISRLPTGSYDVTVSGSSLGSFRETATVSVTEGAVAKLAFATPTPLGGSWRTDASMREARASLTAVSNADAIYVLGGSSSSGTRDIDRFDGTSWTRETTIDVVLNAPAAALVNDEIIVIGGFTGTGNVPTARVRGYGLKSKTWRELAVLPTARGGMQAVVLDGKVHVIGGGNDQTTLSAHEVYDPAQDRWSALSPLPTSRGNPALAVFDGKIYAVGGGAGGGVFTNVDAYDPATDRWTAGPAISPGRVAARAVAYRNGLYVFGGEPTTGNALADVKRLNSARTDWETITPMVTGRSYAASASFGDAVYILGGSTRAPTRHDTPGTTTVERFYIR